jgi:tRNA-dihydrouridine synthase B
VGALFSIVVARCRYNMSVQKFYDNPRVHEVPADVRVPAKLKIGSVEIAPATVLAPMAGITDTVFRRFIREMDGCGLLMTEFTSADGVVMKTSIRSPRNCSAQIPSRWPKLRGW